MTLKDKENLLVGVIMGSFLPTAQKTELIDLIRTEAAKESKPKTKADRIRAMSDEELAEFIFEAPGVPCNMKISAMMKENSCNDCASCIMEWLKQPAE